VTTSAEPPEPVTTPSAAAAPASGRSAGLVAAGILLSRIAGLIRQSIFAKFLGTSEYASVFSAALRMPNALQNLLGEGTLSASFIPVYAGLLERGEHEAAGRLAGATFGLLLAVTGALVIFGILLADLLVGIFFAGYSAEMRTATATCVRIIFPMTGFAVLSAWSIGILNSHRNFFLPYVAPVLWNAAMIATLVFFGTRLGDRDLVFALAWGALAGGLLQFGVQVPRVLRLVPDLRIAWAPRLPALRRVIDNAGPVILGRGVVQLSAWLDGFLASFLFAGALAALTYAQTFYILPISLFAMSVAVAELPEMSRQADARTEILRRRLDTGLRRVAILIIPSTVGYILMGDIVVAALYQNGEFLPSDTLLVALVLAAYSIGLPATTATRLNTSALYAVQDTRTPARAAAVRVAVSAAVGLGLMVLLEQWAVRAAPFGFGPRSGDAPLEVWRPLGAFGLALGTGFASWVEWAWVRRSVSRRFGAAVISRGFFVRLATAALAAAALGRGIAWLLPSLHPALTGTLALTGYGVAYFGTARALGVGDVLEPLTALSGRFGRRRGP
jgi:putative peptidoglycan lipid II flippase